MQQFSDDRVTLDDIAARLAALREAVGNPSFGEIARRIGDLRTRRGYRTRAPGRVTVYDAFRTGRSRMDIELVADIVVALGRAREVPEWRAAHTRALRIRAQQNNGRPSTGRARVTVGGSPSHLIVGRDEELDTAVRFLVGRREEDGDTEPRAILITGLAGVGKSLFARAVASRVRSELGDGVIIEVAMRANASRSAERPDPGSVAEEIERLTKSSCVGLTIVVLDDVTSLDDISVIASALPPTVFVLGTSRSMIDVPEGLLTIGLEPLDVRRSTQLLTSRLADPGAADEVNLAPLADLCGGLPLALVMVAGQIEQRTGWELIDHVERLTHSDRASLAPALLLAYEELEPVPRRTLHFLACHPAPLRVEEARIYLAPLAPDGGEWPVDDALRRLVRENFVDLGADGFLMIHDVVRVLAAEQALTHEPLSMRRSAASTLAAALMGALRAETLSPTGVESFVDAIDVHLGTVELASETGLSDVVAEYAEVLFGWLWATQRLADAVVVYELARRHASRTQRPEFTRRLAAALLASGRTDEGEVLLSQLVHVRDGDDQWYHTHGMLGWAAQMRGDSERAIAETSRALEGAKRSGDLTSAAALTGKLAVAHSETRGALSIADDLASRIDRLEESSERRANARTDLVVGYFFDDRLAAAARAAQQAEQEANALGLGTVAAFARAWRGWVQVWDGSPDAGYVLLADSNRFFQDSNREHPRAWVSLMLADTLLRRGDVEGATQACVTSVEISERLRYRAHASAGRVVLARVAIAEGRFDDAETLLTAGADPAEPPRPRVQAIEALGDLAVASGDVDAAKRHWRTALTLEPPPLLRRTLTERISAR